MKLPIVYKPIKHLLVSTRRNLCSSWPFCEPLSFDVVYNWPGVIDLKKKTWDSDLEFMKLVNIKFS